MSVFPTAGHLASWAGRCPGNDQSAGKRRSGRTRKGSKLLGIALEEAALAATRTKGSYLASPIPTPQAPHRPRPRARRRQALDARRLLAHVHHRRDLPRPRRRLLPTPRPRTPHQTPRRPARSPRPPRHPRNRPPLDPNAISHQGVRSIAGGSVGPWTARTPDAWPLRCGISCGRQQTTTCWPVSRIAAGSASAWTRRDKHRGP